MTNRLSLENSISALYVTFSKYASWKSDESSLGDVTLSQVCALKNKRLRELEQEDFENYLLSLLNTCGEIDDYRHFLPRLIELSTKKISEDAHQWFAGLVFSKLALAHWRDWPKLEITAVEQFLEAWQHYYMSTYPTETPIDELIDAVAQIQSDVTVFLAKWTQSLTEAAYRHFVYLERTYETIDPNAPHTFLSQAQKMSLINWMSSQKTLNWVELGAEKYRHADWTPELLYTIDRVSSRL